MLSRTMTTLIDHSNWPKRLVLGFALTLGVVATLAIAADTRAMSLAPDVEPETTGVETSTQAEVDEDQSTDRPATVEQNIADFESMERAPGLYTSNESIVEQHIDNFAAMEQAPALYTSNESIVEQNIDNFAVMEQAPELYTSSSSQDQGDAFDFDLMEQAPGLFTDQ